MKIGVLTVQDGAFHPNARLKAAAEEQGHQLIPINPYELVLEAGAPLLEAGASLFPKGAPDVILPRQGAPMGEYGFVILGELAAMGIPLVNAAPGIALARHQYRTLQTLSREGLPVPRSCFISRADGLVAAVEKLGGYPVVLKAACGMGGDGVCLVSSPEGAAPWLGTHLAGKQGGVVQEFIPPQGRMDLRVLVIGRRVAGAMSLSPSGNDFRANVHQSGVAKAVALEPEWEKMALAAARACRLDIAGVDMMVPARGRAMVSEVNYSPGFRGLEAATGLDIAGQIIEHAIRQANT